MEFLLLGVIFIAIVGLVIGAYLFLNRRELAAAATARARLHGEDRTVTARSIVKDETVSHLPVLDRWLRGRGITEQLQERLAQAGSAQKPSVFLLATAILAVTGFLVGGRFGGIVSLLLAGVGFVAPWVWLGVARRRRIAAFDEHFPDALDMMANAMRAGYSFQAAAHFLGEEVVAPVGPEFARFYEEQRLGIDVRVALLDMQERIDSLNLKMFVTAVLIQRETGGNLTELLGNLSTLMRARVALQGQIETLTAEPKLSARFLAVLPVLLFFTLSAVNPTFMAPFRTSSAGHILLMIAAASVIVGYFVLMKIADIDV